MLALSPITDKESIEKLPTLPEPPGIVMMNDRRVFASKDPELPVKTNVEPEIFLLMVAASHVSCWPSTVALNDETSGSFSVGLEHPKITADANTKTDRNFATCTLEDEVGNKDIYILLKG